MAETLVKLNPAGGRLVPRLLWTGSFHEGSITVSGLQQYTAVVMQCDADVLLFGSPSYGGGLFVWGGQTEPTTIAYRFYVSGDIITIDDYNTGCFESGGTRRAITHIWGLF